eukprot:359327_1
MEVEDIIEQLLKFDIGDRNDILNALEEVNNKSDINEIMERVLLSKNQQCSTDHNNDVKYDNTFDAFSPTILTIAKFPEDAASHFNALPTYKPQQYGTEAVFKGDKDKRIVFDTSDINFYSRVGQLNMTFKGLQDDKKQDIVYKGTATVFHVDEKHKRAYAITCGHNLIHYDLLYQKTHLLKHAWFDRRITDNWKLYTSSKSIIAYKVDQIWIHPKYDSRQIIDPHDLA